MESEIKTIDEVFQQLYDLAKKPGYLYTLLFMIEEDIFMPISQIKDSNPRIRLSVKEASMLLGLIIKENRNTLLEPDDISTFLAYRKNTYNLLEELHFAFSKPLIEKMRVAIAKDQSGEQANFPTKEEMGKAQNQRESFFYTNEPAYDLEYLSLAPKKYLYDNDWLIKNVGFTIEEAVNIALNIKKHFDKQMRKLPHFSKEKMEELFLKDKRNQNNPEALERHLNFYALYKYKNLLSEPTAEKDSDYIESISCHALCQAIIGLYQLDIEELEKCSGFQKFLDKFSLKFDNNENQDYSEPGSQNVVNWKPIIKINSNCYILPLPYILAQSIYETPYYWLVSDKHYSKTAGTHIGKSSEDIACNFLLPVFGQKNTFQNVKIKQGKEDKTDIDVLCVLGNKALCLQIKSKKLTEKAQIGNDECYKKDFRCAITDAYNQGLECRKLILSKSCELIKCDGDRLDFESIDEVYLLCVTTGFYPAIPQQVRMMLEIKDSATTPVVLNLFDLHIVTHYLSDPYEFLYYIRQRIATNDYFIAENESVLLAYHLKNKLWKSSEYNQCNLGQDIAEYIDEDYPNIFNVSPCKDVSLHCEWITEPYNQLLSEIKLCKDAFITDVLFKLYDLNPSSMKRITQIIHEAKQRSRNNNSTVSMCMSFDQDKSGLTYTASTDLNYDGLSEKMEIFSLVHKYKSKANQWIGLACCAYHPNNVDLIMYDTNMWKKDAEMEKNIIDYDSCLEKRSVEFPKKIGRNELCPCGSGKKYKKCHGQYL